MIRLINCFIDHTNVSDVPALHITRQADGPLGESGFWEAGIHPSIMGFAIVGGFVSCRRDEAGRFIIELVNGARLTPIPDTRPKESQP